VVLAGFARAGAVDFSLAFFNFMSLEPGRRSTNFVVRSPLGWGNTMQEYRAFVMGPDGHVESRIDLFCENEEVAKERAKQLVDGHDIELWQRDQRIAVFRSNQQ
jgi:hypothetical protein